MRETSGGRAAAVEKGGQPLLSAGIPALFFIYVFTPQRQIQFITLFLILLVLGSKAYSEYLIRTLRLARRDRELRVFRHGWISVELWLENTGRLPAFLLVPSDLSGGAAVFRNIKGLYTLGGRRRQIFRWEVYGSDRGVYTLGPARLRGADPLGLFPFVLFSGETSRLFVYPAPAFADIKAPGGIPLGSLLTADPFNEDLTRPRSLRDYSPGDDPRRINWKASAKLAGLAADGQGGSGNTAGGLPLLVNEYELSLSYPLVIFLNADSSEYPLKNRVLYTERVIEAAAALCLMAARERQTLGLIIHTAGGGVDPDSGTVNPAALALIPILERLAALNPSGTGGQVPEPAPVRPGDTGAPPEGEPPEPLQPSTGRLLEICRSLPSGTRLVYLGPEPGEADYRALETLGRRRISLELLVIDERDLGGNPKGRMDRSPVRKYQMKDRGYEIL